jgi:hypothetical protein
VATVAAAEEPSDLPPTWRVHDVQGATLGAQHKGIEFFPTILGNSTADYLLDPARCPTATDKVSIPSADSSEPSCIRRFGVAY